MHFVPGFTREYPPQVTTRVHGPANEAAHENESFRQRVQRGADHSMVLHCNLALFEEESDLCHSSCRLCSP